jgi:hypothetical protein
MLNFTKTEIETMLIKGTNRTLSAKESAKMLKDIENMNETEANGYLKLWSNIQWFKRVYNAKYPTYVILSCNDNKHAYINFLLQDVENTK